MKNQWILLALVVFLAACQAEKSQENDNDLKQAVVKNDLLPQKVIVYNEVNFKEQAIEEWTIGVNQSYFQSLNDKVINSDVALSTAMIYYDEAEAMPMTKEDVLNHMVVQDSAGVTALYFIESWSFDEASYTFEKNIEAWAPVYEFVKEDQGQARKVKSLLYDVKSKSDKAEKLIAENMTYEVNFHTDYKTNEFLDVSRLAELTVKPMLDGKVKAYDFFDENELSIEAIKKAMGYSNDTIHVENPETGELEINVEHTEEDIDLVKAYIFVEDWYIDESNFAIKKKIKAIAPVAISSEVDEYGELVTSKRILGLVKFNN